MKIISVVLVVLLIVYGFKEALGADWKQALVNIGVMAACVIAVINFNKDRESRFRK